MAGVDLVPAPKNAPVGIINKLKWSRGQVEARFANLPPCLIGMEAGVVHIISVANSMALDTMPG